MPYIIHRTLVKSDRPHARNKSIKPIIWVKANNIAIKFSCQKFWKIMKKNYIAWVIQVWQKHTNV